MISGRMIWTSETPADFIASNSNRSPRFPKVISEASKIASGSAIGTRNRAAYINISAKTGIPKPFPTMSSNVPPQELHKHNKQTDAEVIKNNGRKVCSIKCI